MDFELYESKYKLYNNLNYPIAVLDEQSHFIWANQKFLTLHGIKRKSLDNNLIQSIEIALNEGLKNEEYLYETVSKKLYFEPLKSKFKSEGDIHFIITLFDISKRQELQSKLYAKQEMFEQFSEQLPEGIILFRKKIIYSNPAFEKLIGYSGK